MAREVHAEAQETDGTAAEAQGCVPPLSIPTRGSGDLSDQPGATGMGQLLCDRTLQRVLQLHQSVVEGKGRRHMMRARQRKGFGWERWSRQWLYETLKLFNGYKVRRPQPKVAPAG